MLLGSTVIAIPTALLSGLGDLLIGGEDSSAVSRVVFMVVALGLVWAAQFAWQEWRGSRAQRPPRHPR
ncbi:hypothetical protein NWP10_04575 [Micrococcus sp. HG099]|uniref:hypothetical protein n=1 Tax=Micrococcus sp. HG099 TaxID=2969755 RepID=UPI00215B1B81|nr:hypothetical protein [Micrococcus sp. HG099]MCR8675083.1 hypothetical protein [Micrococcus sp. HG099]